MAAAIEDSPPHATSAWSASFFASGGWLTYCRNSASGRFGVSTPTASAVTGHCVSHCTTEPARFAPQNTRWSQPACASAASIAARRRAISGAL